MHPFLDLPKSPSCLAPVGREHTELFLRLQNEPESRQYLSRYTPISEKSELEWIEKAYESHTDFVFAIVDKASQKPVGTMGLHHVNWKNRRGVTGSVMLEEYCNKGLGTSAKMLLLSWAFLELGFIKVESRVLAFNGRSAAYSKKCGYKEVGRLKKHVFRFGRWHDEIIMEVHIKDWMPLWRQFQKKYR